MSLSTTTDLLVVQPPPLTYAGCATPHHQTKKTILFVCLSWHSYLLWYGCSLSPYPSWHAPSGSNSSLLLLDGMSSQQNIFPKKAWAGTPEVGFPLFPEIGLTYDQPLFILAGYRLVMSGPCACSTSMYVQNLSTAHAFAVVWRLICTFCRPSLTSYGISYFLIFHSLWPAPFRGWALLDCGLFFLQYTILLLSAVLLAFPIVPLCHFCCDVIWPKPTGPL